MVGLRPTPQRHQTTTFLTGIQELTGILKHSFDHQEKQVKGMVGRCPTPQKVKESLKTVGF